MQRKWTPDAGFFGPRSLATLVCAIAWCMAAGTMTGFFRTERSANISQRTLTLVQRAAYQRAIEEVYWRHRIWPKENPNPKPSPDAVMPEAQLEEKVSDYLRKSQALEDYWHRPITAEQLQAEMDRMANQTKQPDVLRELFEALGNDPFVIAECLARPSLAERLLTDWYACDQRIHGELKQRLHAELQTYPTLAHVQQLGGSGYVLPEISDTGGCIDNTWMVTSTGGAPGPRWDHTTVWTGSEMIIWGGWDQNYIPFNTGAKYIPSTDSWIFISIANAPDARTAHAAVWTGSEMIVWGGFDGSNAVNTGGKYDPITNSWTSTSTVNAPAIRSSLTAVWTGTEMIVWGGRTDGITYLNSGGRYNPGTNTWTATSTFNAPDGRAFQTAVWTGGEMIIWGGYFYDGDNHYYNSGGRYNPGADSWTSTNLTGAPSERASHTAVWTGSKMIVWGGGDRFGYFDTGGIYDPVANSWMATDVTNSASGRRLHTAIWNGNEMIVWGGFDGSGLNLNTGGRYDPNAHNWTSTSITNPPDPRSSHTAIWTGSEMIVWGGELNGSIATNTGGRYCASSNPSPTASPTPTATPTPTPTPTPCMGRCTPTPRPRPTPAPRP